DAFQAAWLVLARRAGSVRWNDSIAAWLHEVAVRVAQKVRAQAARRENQARELAAMRTPPDTVENGEAELLALVQAGLARLPEKYRAPLVLCYVEGKTNADAARELGCPVGSMSKLLARGKELLRGRLAGRGHALPASALAGLLAPAASVVGDALSQTTVQA